MVGRLTLAPTNCTVILLRHVILLRMKLHASANSIPVPSRLLALVSCIVFLLLTGLNTRSEDSFAATQGEIYYTQFSLFHEKNAWVTTDYRKGILVPINTPVTFLKAGGEAIIVRLPDGSPLKIVNIEEYSGEKIAGLFNHMLGKTPVELSPFTTTEKENILAGTVALGMSKAAVIKALGYPPKHKTPSLDGNQWRYWKNRYGTMLVTFADGRVSDIKK